MHVPMASSAFWNLLKLYTLLGLKLYKAKPSMWVWKQAGAWGRAFTAVFGTDQIVLSSFETTQTEGKHKLYAAEKCLPWPGISTGGLLLMLSRWCLLKPAVGGLKDVPSRAAARALLDAFLSCAGHTSCSFQIDFDGDALLSWPVPPFLQYTCTLSLANGCVDLSPLLGTIPQDWPNAAKVVRTCLKTSFDNNLQIPFADFIQKSMTTKGLHELFSQVLLQLALQIERACGSHVTKGVKAFWTSAL